MEIMVMAGKIFTKQYRSGWWLALSLLLCFVAQLLISDQWNGTLELSSDASALSSRPWSLLSYAFLHHDYLHLGINLLLLVVILLTSWLSGKEVWLLFISAAILGGICFVSLPLEFDASIVGASGGLSALLAVAIHRWLRRKRWWILVLFIIMIVDCLSRGGAWGGSAIHLCGYLVGLSYVWFGKNKLYSKSTSEEYSKELEEVIKKVEVSGYHSLSREEQAALLE